MDKYLDDYIEKELQEEEEIEEQDEYQKKLAEYYSRSFANRKYMLHMAKSIPLKIRRQKMTYRAALDENGKSLGFIDEIPVKLLTVKHMEAILKWAGFEYTFNSSLLLHTIHEELIQRKWK